MNKLDAYEEYKEITAKKIPDVILMLQQLAQDVGWPVNEEAKKLVRELQRDRETWGIK